MSTILAVIQAQAAQQDSRAAMLQMMGLLLIMIVMFYFAIWRPQQKKAKQHEELMKSLKPGDKVVTASGICGVIVSIRDKTVSIRSADAKLEMLKSAISDVIERAGGSSAS
ncbi:MAG TPA: preprotein translocase subunit YajC [Verrucomicrobiota bacterium]|nr:preprotein translocase subunit YajC [Verrucomicrobiota bacterium]